MLTRLKRFHVHPFITDLRAVRFFRADLFMLDAQSGSSVSRMSFG
jgi:hypothetical protein